MEGKKENPLVIINNIMKALTAAQYAASYGISTVYLDADSSTDPTYAPSSPHFYAKRLLKEHLDEMERVSGVSAKGM